MTGRISAGKAITGAQKRSNSSPIITRPKKNADGHEGHDRCGLGRAEPMLLRHLHHINFCSAIGQRDRNHRQRQQLEAIVEERLSQRLASQLAVGIAQ